MWAVRRSGDRPIRDSSPGSRAALRSCGTAKVGGRLSTRTTSSLFLSDTPNPVARLAMRALSASMDEAIWCRRRSCRPALGDRSVCMAHHHFHAGCTATKPQRINYRRCTNLSSRTQPSGHGFTLAPDERMGKKVFLHLSGPESCYMYKHIRQTAGIIEVGQPSRASIAVSAVNGVPARQKTRCQRPFRHHRGAISRGGMTGWTGNAHCQG